MTLVVGLQWRRVDAIVFAKTDIADLPVGWVLRRTSVLPTL